MRKAKQHKWRFDTSEAKGTITAERCSYGLILKVSDGQDRWEFMLDLYHLACDPSYDKRAVQVAAYNPKDPDGQPTQVLIVHPSGQRVVGEFDRIREICDAAVFPVIAHEPALGDWREEKRLTEEGAEDTTR